MYFDRQLRHMLSKLCINLTSMIKQYVEILLLMSSAHVPIFCRKQLLEKVKVRFVIGVSQCTLTVFLSQTKDRTFLRIFYRIVIWHKRFDFFIVLDNGRRDPIVGLRHSDFFIGLKSAHTDRFFIADKLLEGKSHFVSDQKSAHTNRSSFRFF